jgi:formamidopyrimidine-DNA glycosylase
LRRPLFMLTAMPELAEVEYYRKRWDCGLGDEIIAVKVHATKRLFRNVPIKQLRTLLPGSVFLCSEARGKQLLFQFSKHLWLGLHLGMTGKLSSSLPDLTPDQHDHLVLYQRARSLVFSDPRLFGRVEFTCGANVPDWWAKLPAPVDSKKFRRASMEAFLQRHRKLSVKGTLLLQSGFPGIGNWMADEILWRAKVNPQILSGQIGKEQLASLWSSLRLVCRGALKHVSHDFSDPPSGWLFNERWNRGGRCPIHRTPLTKATVAGRTTVWCGECQPAGRVPGGL